MAEEYKMAEDEKINEWEMTQKEKKELEVIDTQKNALQWMVDAHHRIATGIAEMERQWWNKTAKRIGLDKSETLGYYADVRTGKLYRK